MRFVFPHAPVRPVTLNGGMPMRAWYDIISLDADGRADEDGVRDALGLTDRPVVVCVSRLMPRKGQDVLITALPRIRRQVPDTALLLVGGGPHRPAPRTTSGALVPSGI